MTLSDSKYNNIYTIASYLMDPLCATRTAQKQIIVTNDLYPNASSLKKTIIKSSLALKTIGCGIAAGLITPVSLLYRSVMFTVCDKPFIHVTGNGSQIFSDQIKNNISLLSWNLCCVPAGYSITDGGVLPWPNRIKKLIDVIKIYNPDVLCLYEIFDIQTANILVSELGNKFCDFYYNIGPCVIGLSSGLFVASKYHIIDANYTPFPKEALDGRAKFSRKGFFNFTLSTKWQAKSSSFALSEGNKVTMVSEPVASRIKVRGTRFGDTAGDFTIRSKQNQNIKFYTTHLQHSEIPVNPTLGEINARKKEMEMIVDHIASNSLSNDIIIVTGDLNLDDNEYANSDWNKIFNKGVIHNDYDPIGDSEFFAAANKYASHIYSSTHDDLDKCMSNKLPKYNLVSKHFTWSGDLVPLRKNTPNRIISNASNLDHTMLVKNKNIKFLASSEDLTCPFKVSITTSLVETGYDAYKFNPDALSDHMGLYSIIILDRSE
jgi:hypothetical protein